MRVFQPILLCSYLLKGAAFTISQSHTPACHVSSSALGSQNDSNDFVSSRRGFMDIAGTSIIAAASLAVKPELASASDYSGSKVLVLGGTGFVGSEVCKKLKSLGVDVIATSRDGRDGTLALDFGDSSIDVAKRVEEMAKGCTGVVSCIGSIGTPNDKVVNSGTGLSSIGAKAAGVKNFVYISVAPEVRDASKGLSFLKDYMDGKAFSEDSIKNNFADGYTIIAPTFIYGGDKFAINPPRVADGYGRLVEGVLSSGPFRFAAGISPGIIGVALEPPVKVGDVAGAAVAGALGLSASVLDTYDEINEAALLI
jgi:uncharacterized protein YbjT (DUF2867 family)